MASFQPVRSSTYEDSDDLKRNADGRKNGYNPCRNRRNYYVHNNDIHDTNASDNDDVALALPKDRSAHYAERFRAWRADLVRNRRDLDTYEHECRQMTELLNEIVADVHKLRNLMNEDDSRTKGNAVAATGVDSPPIDLAAGDGPELLPVVEELPQIVKKQRSWLVKNCCTIS